MFLFGCVYRWGSWWVGNAIFAQLPLLVEGKCQICEMTVAVRQILRPQEPNSSGSNPSGLAYILHISTFRSFSLPGLPEGRALGTQLSMMVQAGKTTWWPCHTLSFSLSSTKPQGQETTCIFSWIEMRFLEGTHMVAPRMAAESKARIGMLWLLAACLV